jgi:predicted acylesterase/phospholipase RssA/CRP-like cAMP-binding protein
VIHRTTPGEAGALAQVPIFRDVEAAALAALERQAVRHHIEAGAWLFREGDDADALFVVVSGRLRIVVTGDGEERSVRELGPGAALGELALLTGSARSAGAQAARDCELMEVSREAFARLLEEEPGFARAVAVELARQLQASGGLAEPVSRPKVLAVVPLSPTVDGERFAGSLERELLRGGSVAILRGDEPAEARPAELARAEASADFVLLVAGGPLATPAWDAFARRHADRTLLLADADTPIRPEAGATDLVLIAPLPTMTTVRWLEAVAPSSHHLVYEAGYDRGVARVARRVSGRSLGLVLSGGGARGFAHIGVIGALAEAGFEVDRLGGCSMGAFIAGMSALGLDTDQIRDRCHDELVRRAPFNAWTLPRVALIRTGRAARMLERVFGELQVEELARPLYTVSADLLSSRVVVHRRGSLLEAVGASMSIPGLVPPVAQGGRLLVDGGVLDNLPVDLMHDTPEGPIVAVDVVRRLEIEPGESPRIPSIMETMTRATVLGSVERAERNRSLATLMVSPDVHDVGLREFKALDRAIAAGYAAASAALAEGGADLLRAELA